MRFKVAEQSDMGSGFDIHAKFRGRVEEVDRRRAEAGSRESCIPLPASTEFTSRYVKWNRW